jgi:hypothetical protein
MAEISKNLTNVPRLDSLTENQIRDTDKVKNQKSDVNIDGVEIPIGRPDESAQSGGAKTKKSQQLMPDAVIGRDISQLESAEQVRSTGYVSATDKLLGLDLQPTMLGVLAPPPGNNEALRSLTPTMRRKIMRNLLGKQRERMRRLTGSLRRQRDDQSDEDTADSNGESFAAMMLEDYILTMDQMDRATDELSKMAKMLDVLDEMLGMQDFTISQTGTFSQG